MTGRVVRGSLWGIGGQALPLVASLLATPFVISALGIQGNAAWVLVNTIITTLAFSDAGMNTASTKWTAQAYARGDADEERRVLWTTLVLASVPIGVFALACALGAPWLIERLWKGPMPPELFEAAVWTLRLACGAFAVRSVAHIFNSPLLARLRIDINQCIMGGGMALQVGLIPLALHWRGMVGGAIVMLAVGCAMSLAQVAVASRCIPRAWKPSFDLALVRPLLSFGGPAVVSAIVVQLLANVERLMLPSLSSPEALSFYGASATAAGVLGVVPMAMSQALLPAFSRQLASGDHAALQTLVTRAMRGIVLAVLPLSVLSCAVARPFFLFLGGPKHGWEFALNSTGPFYVLVAGVFLSTLAFVPTTLMIANGFTKFAAKYSLGEFVPYIVYTALLTQQFGIYGAAAARVIRFALTCAISVPIAQKKCGVSFSPQIASLPSFTVALALLLAPLLLLFQPGYSFGLVFAAAMLGTIGYLVVVACSVLSPSERQWAQARVGALGTRLKRK
jgi:O-antigen/teichoic acid export membrane protein